MKHQKSTYLYILSFVLLIAMISCANSQKIFVTGKIVGFDRIDFCTPSLCSSNKSVQILNGIYSDTLLFALDPRTGLTNYDVYLDGQFYDNISTNKYWISSMISGKKIWISDSIHEFDFIKNEYNEYWNKFIYKFRNEAICNYSVLNEIAIVRSFLDNSLILNDISIVGIDWKRNGNELAAWKITSEDTISIIQMRYLNHKELITIECNSK